MAEDCCKLVGNLEIGINGCIVSVNVNSQAEIIKECGDVILLGPSTGTVSITGYTSESPDIHVGCPGRVGVSIPWVRRFDCDEGTGIHLIPAGQGPSYLAGDIEGLATLNNDTGRSYTSVNANASSGPSSVYMETEQVEGYGLTYNGGPISFNTSQSMVFPNFGVGSGDMYLQNFSLEMSPGQVPTANYSFMFVII